MSLKVPPNDKSNLLDFSFPKLITRDQLDDQIELKYRLTLGDLAGLDLAVEQYSSRHPKPTIISTKTANEIFRNDPTERLKFIARLSSHQNLNKALKLPSPVSGLDLFEKFWPKNMKSKYLQSRSKSYSILQKHYESAPYCTYGGSSQWKIVIRGRVNITLYEPSLINSSQVYDDEVGPLEFKHQMDTDMHFKLGKGDFIFIPCGWICKEVAEKETAIYGGELFHMHDFRGQIECLESDIEKYKHMFTACRDAEIRSLFWFTAMTLLSAGRDVFRNMTYDEADFLKTTLLNWRKIGKAASSSKSYYSPDGLDVDYFSKDVVNVVSDMRRKSIKKT